MVRTVQGFVARLVRRGLRHSLESTHWHGVLAVLLGPVRNGDDGLKVPLIQLFSRLIRLDLQHQEQIFFTSEANGLRRVVGLDLNALPVRSDGVISAGPSTCVGETPLINTSCDHLVSIPINTSSSVKAVSFGRSAIIPPSDFFPKPFNSPLPST